MTARIHAMPFGAQLHANGETRFRLWAPTARQVELMLPGRTQTLSMHPLNEGWYERVTTAPAGTLYRYRVDGELTVPDPASRHNPQDVHGPSEVIDPAEYQWQDARWEGHPWHQTVAYELHVGTFSPQGTFAGLQQRLDHLEKLGITTLQLMPLADFPGKHNWGYDGVLPFAPDTVYGRPEDLKRLVDAAHARGLMVMLDVVYNHFGPEGNYLHAYAKSFFTRRHRTPWGEAINFDDRMSRTVREFFIHNALYWLEEYHLDGLRFDAVHAVHDDTTPDIFTEISRRVRERFGRERQIHLVLENVNNEAYRLDTAPAAAGRFEAQWNDDFHHCLHTLLTGERDGYYADYADDAFRLLGRCLAEGFAYQGEISRFHRNKARGEASAGLPPTCFVSFLQNHDQIGNRACGERLAALVAEPRALKAAAAVMLLTPQIPMLFMGEEWGALEPFPFFCDFEPGLAQAVREGRLREFARFDTFSNAQARARIPDPCAPATAAAASLDWSRRDAPGHLAHLAYYRQLLEIRQRDIAPHLPGVRAGRFELTDGNLLIVRWPLKHHAELTLTINLTRHEQPLPAPPAGRILFASDPPAGQVAPAWSVLCSLA